MISNEEKLQVSQLSLCKSILNAVPEPSFLIDEKGLYLDAFGGLDKSRHHDPKLAIGKHLTDFFSPEETRTILNRISQVIETGHPQVVEYSINADTVEAFSTLAGPTGKRYFEAYLSLVLTSDEKKSVLCTARCVTDYKVAMLELSEQKAQLARASQIDHLTNVYNRYALDNLLPLQLEVAKQKGQSLTAIMIDLDYFKELNDRHGHLEGDKALIKMAKVLRETFSGHGSCFRYGGDEFLVVLFDYDLSEIEKHTESFREALSDAEIKNQESPISEHLTATIAVLHQENIAPDMAVEQLVYFTDQALFSGRVREKNSVCFL